MTPRLCIVIHGQPKAWQRAGQRVVNSAGRTFTRTFTKKPTRLLEAWIRGKAERAMQSQGWATTDCAVVLSVEFVLVRPKTRARAPHADRRPDLDNYEKAVLDALSLARVYTDDARVVRKHSSKRYARPGEPPATIVDVELA